MTRKEFLDFIDSFDINPGEYNDDQLYLIGVAHKSLNKADKDWAKLANILGLEKSGEAFRGWINTRQRADGTLPKNMKELNGRTITEVSEEELSDNITNQIADLYKQQVKTRDTFNTYRRALRADAREEDFKDMLLDAVSKFEPLQKIESKYESVEDGKEAVMLLSDLHLGCKVDSFYNKYNVDIARRRVQKYVDKTIEYCVNNNVTRLNVLNLGDLIHGIIHITGRIEAETNVVEQIMLASEILADALNQLTAAAPEVIYRSCTDNHSRAIANYKENIEAENFGKIIDHYLKARLQNSNVTFAEDNLDDEIGLFELKNGKKLLFIHGHHDNYNTVAQSYLGATRQFIDYICLGHYHSSKLKSFQGVKVIVNGSIIGSEQYAYSKRLFGDPEQTLLIFDGNSVSINYINLGDI